MKVNWKTIMLFAVIVTIVWTVFDLMSSSKGQVSLQQYEVEVLNPNIGTGILEKVASQTDRMFTHSEDIGIVDI
jgi:hypothetical protein